MSEIRKTGKDGDHDNMKDDEYSNMMKKYMLKMGEEGMKQKYQIHLFLDPDEMIDLMEYLKAKTIGREK